MSERVLFAEITVFKRDFRMKVNENNEIDDLKTRQYRQHRQQFQRKVKKQEKGGRKGRENVGRNQARDKEGSG